MSKCICYHKQYFKFSCHTQPTRNCSCISLAQPTRNYMYIHPDTFHFYCHSATRLSRLTCYMYVFSPATGYPAQPLVIQTCYVFSPATGYISRHATYSAQPLAIQTCYVFSPATGYISRHATYSAQPLVIYPDMLVFSPATGCPDMLRTYSHPLGSSIHFYCYSILNLLDSTHVPTYTHPDVSNIIHEYSWVIKFARSVNDQVK